MATKAQQGRHNGNGSASELSSQIDNLRGEIATVAGVVSQLASAAGRRRLERKAKRLGKQAEKRVSEAQHALEGSVETIDDMIRERPMQSALLAFGLGVLVGRLFLGGRD
jgi:ElaB/YqjD/DUF883 family membrane-anchored ribosome-binding protein